MDRYRGNFRLAIGLLRVYDELSRARPVQASRRPKISSVNCCSKARL